MIELRAEQLKQHKKTLKKQVGLAPESDAEEEVIYIAPKKKKIVYVESESEEEEVVYRNSHQKRRHKYHQLNH